MSNSIVSAIKNNHINKNRKFSLFLNWDIMSQKASDNNEKNNDSEPEENREPPRSLALDLGDDCVYNVEAHRLESQPTASGATGVQDCSNTRREENPFSFKHFLRDSSNGNKNYQSLGARPKVYKDSRSRHVTPPGSPQRPNQSARKIGEFSSALPDFVQDHLVIEQCFLDKKTNNSTPTFDLNLPDFAHRDQRTPSGPSVSRSNSIEDPTIGPIPLDLPGLSLGNAFPLDLPMALKPPTNESRTVPLAEVGNSKSLPDFLTDGPVRTSADAVTPTDSANDHSREPSRCGRCAELTFELTALRQRLSRTDDEVERNYRRATVAENTMTRLKQELKSLKIQVRQLQAENEALRAGNAGAAGGDAEPRLEFQTQRLADELKAAASTAEQSLRSLLTGVDNLRFMASTLENFHRIEERPAERFSRFDDEGAGPAL